jgi:hypothetical protein
LWKLLTSGTQNGHALTLVLPWMLRIWRL